MLKLSRVEVKYYSQYRSHGLFELQESLSGLSKSNRWVKLADHLPWDRIEKEYNKRLRNRLIKKKRKGKDDFAVLITERSTP